MASSSLAARCTACLLAAAAAVAAHGDPVKEKFDILEFRVLGNHLLETPAIERAVYPFLGPAGDLDTVKKAADSLEKAYKDAGYGTIYVDIPEQQVDDGIVRLKVTEGRLERVHIRGERYFSARQIRAALPALQVGATPSLPALQKQLGELNARTADRVVTPVLKAGSEPGAVAVDLAVQDTFPLHASVSYDNRHTADSTPNRATVGLSYGNLWQRQDTLSLQYQTAPANRRNAEVFLANYLAHLGDGGGLGVLSYIHTSSNVLAVGTLGVLGSGSIYGAHWMQLLSSSATDNSSVNLGADYKNVATEIFPDATSQSTGAVTAPVRYVNWSAILSNSWRPGPQQLVASSFGVGFGINGLVNRAETFANARYNATPDYFLLRGSVDATEALPLGFALDQRIGGQWSGTPLLNNEQYSLGGVDTVRGYLEAEALGDSGLNGSFELHTPSLGARVTTWLSPLYLFGFVDGGVATLNDPLPSQDYKVRLWSYGFGLRLTSPRGLSGTVLYALPQVSGPRTRAGDGHVDFVFSYGF